MQELEKILEEIEEGTHTFELLGRDVDFVAIDWVRDVIRKHMNDGCVPEVEKILDKIEAEHPYKVPGKRDTYSQYNEGWIDAIDRVRGELERLNDGWISVKDRLPEKDDFYIATLNGRLVGQKEPFVGLAEFEHGEWEDGDAVIAWRPLPEPYRPEQPETCKYTSGSCCWPIDQCGERPNHPERSDNYDE